MEVRGEIYVSVALLKRKKNLVPIKKGAGWASELAKRFWRRENFLALTRIRTPDLPASRLVCKPAALFRLPF